MKKANLFVTLLLSASVISGSLIAAPDAQEQQVSKIKSAMNTMQKRVAKVGRCLRGKEACSPGDFAAIIVSALILNGFIVQASSRQLPKKYRQYPFSLSPTVWGHKIAQKIVPIRQ